MEVPPDASKAMLTPSTERTEKKLKAALKVPDRTEQETVSGIKDHRVVEEGEQSVRGQDQNVASTLAS